MTEVGKTQIEEVMEERAIAEKPMPEYAKFLKEEQVTELIKAGYTDKLSIRAASDEELIKVNGVGPATILKLREWGVVEVEKGDAVAKRFLALRDGADSLDVRPGDIIPARFGAERWVKSGKATWK